jgi:TRAP-type C4-dicarboxylate transport system permease small subunit
MVRKVLDRLYLFAGYAAGGFLIILFLLMMALALGREVGINVRSGDDFGSWCMVAMAFLGLAHTFRSGEMIRVGLLLERFQGRKKHVMEIVALGIATAFILYFTRQAVQLTYDSWRFHDVSQGVVTMVHVLRGNKPRYEKEKPQSPDELVERIASEGSL